MMIAIITINSSLVTSGLIEGLCRGAQILYFRFEIISGLRSLLLSLLETWCHSSNCVWNSFVLLLVNSNILSNLQPCVSSLPPVRTDNCVGKSEAVNTLRIPWEIIIPRQLMTNSQIQVGTLESQLNNDYDLPRLLGMSHLMEPGFPAMKKPGGFVLGTTRDPILSSTRFLTRAALRDFLLIWKSQVQQMNG